MSSNKFKDTHYHILLDSIAKARGIEWKFQDSLSVCESDQTITADLNGIAKKLLGQTATSKTLKDPETIIDYIIKLPNYETLVAEAREILKKDGIELPNADTIESYRPGTSAWFRRMIEAVS